jgi:hypothetical protein
MIYEFLSDKNYIVAIADHNEISGGEKLRELGATVIPAIELGCADGFELLVYFKTKEQCRDFFDKYVIPNRHPTRMARTTQDVWYYLEILKNYNVYISIPHPIGYAQKNYIKNKSYFFKAVRNVDALECHNHGLPKSNNFHASEIARIYGKGMTFGSDAHSYQELESNSNFILKRKIRFGASIDLLHKVKVLSQIGYKHMLFMLNNGRY